MATKNPFELGTHAGAKRTGEAKRAPRTWTAEEQAEKLQGYLEIPRDHWAQIRYGTHVRYITEADGFRTGGFVLRNPFGTGGKQYIRLQNGFNQKANGYAQWVVDYEKAVKIFVKPDAAVMVMMKSLEASVLGLNRNIRKIAEHARKLEARLAALERG